MLDGTAAPQAEARSNQTRTDLILEVTRRFTSTLELDKVLGQVLSLTVDTIDADRGSIFVLDQSGRVSHKILARWYLPPHQSEEVISIVMRQGAAGFVFRHQQPVLITDTATDERWVHLPDDPNVTRSALSVPLLNHGRLNGILTLTHAAPAFFDDDDLALIINIAGQAAVAVENARLFDRVRRERATLHAVISDVAEGILITDSSRRIQYANPAGATALGFEAAARGRILDDVSPDQRLLVLFRTLLASSRPQRGEVYGSDGRVFDASLALVPGAGVVITLHDVTRFKELDALKSEFVDTVSHDLKAPLGLVYGYAWMLADSPSLDTESRRYVDEILDGVQKMQQIITSLLDLTVIESGIDQVREPVDVSKLIHEGLAAFGARVREKDLQVTVRIHPSLPQISGHSIRLSQAINNLISNAIRFTARGGHISLSAELDGEEVLVRVSDTGPGIPSEKRAGLFSRFYKVGGSETLSQEGHGLGLAIVKSVVEAHGGRVGVESVVGQGSTFFIAFPLTPRLDASFNSMERFDQARAEGSSQSGLHLP
jgi:signal transduction histidine kinase